MSQRFVCYFLKCYFSHEVRSWVLFQKEGRCHALELFHPVISTRVRGVRLTFMYIYSFLRVSNGYVNIACIYQILIHTSFPYCVNYAWMYTACTYLLFFSLRNITCYFLFTSSVRVLRMSVRSYTLLFVPWSPRPCEISDQLAFVSRLTSSSFK